MTCQTLFRFPPAWAGSRPPVAALALSLLIPAVGCGDDEPPFVDEVDDGGVATEESAPATDVTEFTEAKSGEPRESPPSVEESPPSVEESPPSVEESPSSVEESPSSVEEEPPLAGDEPASTAGGSLCMPTFSENDTVAHFPDAIVVRKLDDGVEIIDRRGNSFFVLGGGSVTISTADLELNGHMLTVPSGCSWDLSQWL